MRIVNHKTYGEAKRPPLYIAHGVFGMLDNWHNIAQNLAEYFFVITYDARNHGKSFHDDDAGYDAMAEDLKNLSDKFGHDTFNLIGHSMGGKTAMKFVDLYPNKVSNLIVVDIAPKAYKASHTSFIQAFKEIPFDRIANRKDADLAFSEYANDMAIRQFLLKNIESRPEGGYQLKINVDAIEYHYLEIIGGIEFQNTHNLPCTFIAGGNSHYIGENDFIRIKNIFPNAKLISIKNAGHWVHAEQPQAFVHAIKTCLIDTN